MKVGMIGLPQSGKTTLFYALTRGEGSPAGDGGNALVSVVPLPDSRYDFAIDLFNPKKRTPASIEFTDGAATISGGDRGKQKFSSDFFVGICQEVSKLEKSKHYYFLNALGIKEPARNRLIRASYAALGQMSFFTVGEDEVRAWTVRDSATAVEAAGRIHSDLARGFIRAEVMAFDELIAAKTWDAAKAAGKLRPEGKDYPVKDGDIVHIRFKV